MTARFSRSSATCSAVTGRPRDAEGKLVGWSSSKFPCELAEAFDLNVMYPENQAAGIAANRDGEIMCKAAEDLLPFSSAASRDDGNPAFVAP